MTQRPHAENEWRLPTEASSMDLQTLELRWGIQRISGRGHGSSNYRSLFGRECMLGVPQSSHSWPQNESKLERNIPLNTEPSYSEERCDRASPPQQRNQDYVVPVAAASPSYGSESPGKLSSPFVPKPITFSPRFLGSDLPMFNPLFASFPLQGPGDLSSPESPLVPASPFRQPGLSGLPLASLKAPDDEKVSSSPDAKRKKLNKDELWSEMFGRLLKYKLEHGDSLVPPYYVDDPKLGSWVGRQRRAKDTLSPHQLQQLNSIGFEWHGRRQGLWDLMFARLLDYREKNGDCRVPSRYDKDPKLGRWVIDQRSRHAKLQPDRIEKLNSIGFVWKIKDCGTNETWDAMFDRLVEYKARHGDCLVPRDYAADPKLARWVGNQRVQKNRGDLSEENIRLLESIGYEWRLRYRETWETMFNRLKEYKQKHGDTLVPTRSEEYKHLGVWVSRQRAHQEELAPERKELLNSIGFVWRIRKRRRKDT